MASRRRPMLWRVLVPVICLVAGFGFAVSAHESQGTELRPPGIANLTDLVTAAEQRVHAEDAQLAALQAQVQAAAERGSGNAAVAAVQAQAAALAGPGGLTPVHGPGITVVLDDAHDTSGLPANTDLNQLLIHQSDVRSVVNALWTGGAEDMSIMGQRVIATSAVRCVGPTLLINGEVFSPPYTIEAIGPYSAMVSALDASPGVRLFTQAAEYYGLGYTVEQQDNVSLAGYHGSIALQYARPAGK